MHFCFCQKFSDNKYFAGGKARERRARKHSIIINTSAEIRKQQIYQEIQGQQPQSYVKFTPSSFLRGNLEIQPTPRREFYSQQAYDDVPGEVIRSFDDAAQRLLHTRDIITVTELFSVIGQVLSYCNRVKNKAPDKLVDLVVDIYRKIEVQDEKSVQRACIFMSSLSKLGLDPAHSIFKDIQNQLLQADTPFYCVNIRNYAEVYRTLAYLHSYANSKLRKKIESVLLKPQWLVRMSDQEVDSIVWSCRYFQYPSLEILAAVEKEILNREDLRQFSATYLNLQ
eukprot:TRINITY_DN35113_c0_g1_i2.p1 TRINITY_DN35113_c0_g1~~TRINITY_DN35113_c0_g1_i2.p1  ORF type:complete len:282 (+),score=16.23 TRINITY_DN35113_c0_g1_i2:67-912(+)